MSDLLHSAVDATHVFKIRAFWEFLLGKLYNHFCISIGGLFGINIVCVVRKYVCCLIVVVDELTMLTDLFYINITFEQNLVVAFKE